MKASAVAVVAIVLVSILTTGCAQNRQLAEVQRENVELKARVAALESRVAEFKEPRTPITVNGLTIGAIEPLPDLKLTPDLLKPAQRETYGVMGQGRLILSGTGTTYQGAVTLDRVTPWTITSTTKTAATTTTTPSTTTTTTTSAPAK